MSEINHIFIKLLRNYYIMFILKTIINYDKQLLKDDQRSNSFLFSVSICIISVVSITCHIVSYVTNNDFYFKIYIYIIHRKLILSNSNFFRDVKTLFSI